ncbi:MAG: KH domain-containing protein [Candidatus Woesearchaeota archaeon]
MAEYSYELKIPKERVAVLIGIDGTVKSNLENETKTKIKVDSEEGDVFIKGDDAILLFNAREVVKAIGRGFNPEISFLLLKSDYMFELISLMDVIKSKNSIKRLKGRVIGHEGKARRIIEEMTECHVSVYGKTIGVIGRAERIGYAKEAVKKLIEGSPHSSVYKWLEKKRKEMGMQDIFFSRDENSDIKDEFRKEL